MIRINNNWEFTTSWSEDFMKGSAPGTVVRLPHTVRESPLHYASPADYEMISGYRKVLDLPADLHGKRVFLQFDGAAHIAEVFINGIKVAEHRSGYTAFRAEITEHLKKTDNVVAVRLDSTENSSIPPFGFVIDYLTFGGLYRDVWLDIRSSIYLETLTTDSRVVRFVWEEIVDEPAIRVCLRMVARRMADPGSRGAGQFDALLSAGKVIVR